VRDSGGIEPHILGLGKISLIILPLYPQIKLPYSDWMLGLWGHRAYLNFMEKRNLLPLPEI
jgi:hypothetical protein